MVTFVASICSVVVPEAGLVWASSGAFVAMALAAALAVSVAALFAVREPTGIADRLAGAARLPDPETRLPSAA